jgi:hypothetical protein
MLRSAPEPDRAEHVTTFKQMSAALKAVCLRNGLGHRERAEDFNAVNDSSRYSVRGPASGTYNVKIRFGKDTDLGKWPFYTAGVNMGAQRDAYSSGFTFAEVDLGNVTYSTFGNEVFRFTVTRNNGASSGSGTAIDYAMLTGQ